MKLITFLNNWTKAIPRSRITIVFTSVAGLVSGICSTMLIAVISRALSRPGSTSGGIVWQFIGLVLLTSVLGVVSQALMLRLNRRAILHLRMQLCRQILSAPLRKLEERGIHRFLGTLTDDIPTITSTLSMLPGAFTNVATLVAFLAYLGWLSVTGLLILICAVVVGSSVYLAIVARARRFSELAREEWDSLLKGYRGLTGGIKELKLHHRRREEFLRQDLDDTSWALARYRNIEGMIYLIASNWSPLFCFAIIAVMLFGLPRVGGVEPRVLLVFTFGILFLISPIGGLLGISPAVTRARVAVARLEKLGLSMMDQLPPPQAASLPDANRAWSTLELKGVSHSYFLEHEGRSFVLGPIDLKLDRGGMTFIIGGNGSGKTTLVKLLTGLYSPEEGDIWFDDQVIHDDNREYYRQHFSV
ncbi:MAG: ATP-binding cassette domain-containing protein, partial [Blastocatellia bacterium]